MTTLSKIKIEGYKSIRQAELELRRVNVLIGANGAGKSNLISFFKLLWELSAERLALFVAKSGGASCLLSYGAKTTPNLSATLEFADPVPMTPMPIMPIPGLKKHAAYHLCLSATDADRLLFDEEGFEVYDDDSERGAGFHSLGHGHAESRLKDASSSGAFTAPDIWGSLRRWRTFQFHDTTPTAAIRRGGYIHDNRMLHGDAGNLAAFLYRLRNAADPAEHVVYNRIVQTIRQFARWFDDFVLEPSPLSPETILLNWRESKSDVTFGPHQLPDGALRGMALVTLLLQPESMLPSVLLIDEPELGLHPYAINVITSLVQKASYYCQVVLATQSVSLLEQFDPDEIVVVEREDGGSTFTRLDPGKLDDWLEDYSLGELWEKNVIGGGPA